MNAMVHDMTWDAIQHNEGESLQVMFESEADDVSGGFWNIVAYVAIGAITGAAGYAAGYWANRD